MNRSTILTLSLFAIAMGFLESAVVVYMRALYYPEGFAFPLKLMDENIMLTELLREAATLVMLVTVALLSARKAILRLAAFIYAFAIWDIFYYIFLRLLLGWPESLLTWDLLFLIPATWTGPVLAPVINSLTMILLAAMILWASTRRETVRLSAWEWGLLIAGSLITILGYILDYSQYMMQSFSLGEWYSLTHQDQVLEYATRYVPAAFPWWLFLTGEAIFLVAIGWFRYRYRKNR